MTLKTIQYPGELDDADDYLITELMAFRRWLDNVEDTGREEGWIRSIDEAIIAYLNTSN